jgi:hypothetical protein
LTGRWLTLNKVLRTRVRCVIAQSLRESLVRAQALCSAVTGGLTRAGTSMRVYKISINSKILPQEYTTRKDAEFAWSVIIMTVGDLAVQIHELNKGGY